MKRRTNPLAHVRVAAPCSADWERMTGNERVRFCARCNLNVYNLSEMTKTEAERLIVRSEGRLCVRYYRRADGTILTRNCPVGLRALKRRLSKMANAVASLLLSFFAGVFAFAGLQKTSPAPVYPEADYELGQLVAKPVDRKPPLLEEKGELLMPQPVMGTTADMATAPEGVGKWKRTKRQRNQRPRG